MATRMTSDRPAEQSLQLRFDAFELDEADARLTRDGQPVPLAPKPFAVLCALARHTADARHEERTARRVWGHRFVSDSVLKIDHQRSARGAGRRSETTALHRDGVAARLSLHRRARPPPRDSRGAARRAAGHASSMIGRADALERLRAAWQLAGAGRRQIVWIAGEAGVGKTTLIERFMAEVGEVHCAHGQCVEQYGAGEPYLPVLEALDGVVPARCRPSPS